MGLVLTSLAIRNNICALCTLGTSIYIVVFGCTVDTGFRGQAILAIFDQGALFAFTGQIQKVFSVLTLIALR